MPEVFQQGEPLSQEKLQHLGCSLRQQPERLHVPAFQ